MLTLLLLACSLVARPCEDAECLAGQAVEDWPGDPAGVTARVVAMNDQVARAVVVSKLGEAYPGQTMKLCDALPHGFSRDRCRRLNDRPHLAFRAGQHPAPTAVAPVSGGAPASMGATASGKLGPKEHYLPLVRLPVGEATVEEGLCVGVPDPAACLEGQAVEAVARANPARANAICSLRTEQRWADECRFNAAEEVIRIHHGPSYAAAAAMCGVASEFTEECWVHILTWLPRAIPTPEAGPTPGREAAGLADAVRVAWAGAGEGVADVHVDRFWALYFAQSYRQTPAPDGTPLGDYPEAAAPHIRAAAAMRLRELGALHGSLAQQLATFQEKLAHRSTGVAAARPKPPTLVFVKYLDVAEATAPTAFFLNSARRPTSADPDTDALLALVVSAAYSTPPDTALLAEAAQHSDPRVAEEAKRLSAALLSAG